MQLHADFQELAAEGDPTPVAAESAQLAELAAEGWIEL